VSDATALSKEGFLLADEIWRPYPDNIVVGSSSPPFSISFGGD